MRNKLKYMNMIKYLYHSDDNWPVSEECEKELNCRKHELNTSNAIVYPEDDSVSEYFSETGNFVNTDKFNNDCNMRRFMLKKTRLKLILL